MKTLAELKSLEESYLMGYDCGKNGATGKNCHFSLFATADHTKSWEQGKADAMRESEPSKEIVRKK